MNRRDFIKNTSLGAASFAAIPAVASQRLKKPGKTLAAYYFLAGMYTLRPASIRAELDEMADWGTNIVCIGLTAMVMNRAPRNVEFIVEECHKRGMKLHVVPSRIAGITAGAPIVPSSFSQLNPDCWIKNENGATPPRKVGPICSFYHPKVEAYYHSIVTEMMDMWDLDGFIWDEPKSTYWQDFSELALENNPEADFSVYLRDMTDFFSRVNKTIKDKNPKVTTVYFDEALRPDPVVEESAKMRYLDYFGTDGKPWPAEVSPEGKGPRSQKSIFRNGQRYLQAARENGLKTMVLSESHANTKVMNDLMEEYLPEVIKMDIDYLAYYYYGRNQEQPERNMQIIKENIRRFLK